MAILRSNRTSRIAACALTLTAGVGLAVQAPTAAAAAAAAGIPTSWSASYLDGQATGTALTIQAPWGINRDHEVVGKVTGAPSGGCYFVRGASSPTGVKDTLPSCSADAPLSFRFTLYSTISSPPATVQVCRVSVTTDCGRAVALR